MKRQLLFILAAVLALVLTASGATSATADSGSNTYVYLVDTDIAVAPNGDTIELIGSGTLGIHPKTASGGGTFTHRDADGNVLGEGTWTATELLSFHSYGSGAVQDLPPEWAGGKALIRVHLSPAAGGPGFDGILRVTCLLGDQIPAGAEEGVRLNLLGSINFNKEVSGLTLFIQQ